MIEQGVKKRPMTPSREIFDSMKFTALRLVHKSQRSALILQIRDIPEQLTRTAPRKSHCSQPPHNL